MDIIGKIRRTIRCKVEHFHKNLFMYMHDKRRVNFFSKKLSLLYMSYYYRNWVGYFPDYIHPRDINEELLIQGLKNKKNPLFHKCVDKYEVREYVSTKGYAGILNEIYGVYDSEEDIPFDKLPNQFVMKITNASGYNIICTNKSELDIQKTKHKLKDWLLQSIGFGLASCEWQYSYSKPRILVEKYLSSLSETSLVDYKFHCFRGKVHSCFVAYDRSTTDPHGSVKYDHYDIDWNITDAIKSKWRTNRSILHKPLTYLEMLKVAAKLSEDFDYVRVDLYEIEGRIMFGELTFTPNGYVMDYYEQWMLDQLGLECKNV